EVVSVCLLEAGVCRRGIHGLTDIPRIPCDSAYSALSRLVVGAVGPPAPPIADPRKVAPIAPGAPLRREGGERPAAADEERFHVDLERRQAIDIAEEVRPRRAVLGHDEEHALIRILAAQCEALGAA